MSKLIKTGERLFDVWLGNMYFEKRNIIIAIVALLFIGGAVAVFVLRPWEIATDTATLSSSGTTPTVPPDRPAGHGNTLSNISGNGFVAIGSCGEWIFRREGLPIRLVKTRIDGTEYQVMDTGNGHVSEVSVVGEWVYHTRVNDSITSEWYRLTGAIYRMRLDGTEAELIVNDFGTFLHVIDGWIYYLNQDSNFNLYRVRTDGTGHERISDSVIITMNVADGWVFYNLFSQRHLGAPESLFSQLIDDSIYISQNSYIYKVRVDGTERTRLSNVNSNTILVDDGWIYYTDFDNNFVLYRMRLDGTEVMRVIDDPVNTPNIVDGWIYYVNFVEDIQQRRLYKVRIDGTERQRVHDYMVGHFNIGGGWIFYARALGFAPSYKLSLDGTTHIALRTLR